MFAAHPTLQMWDKTAFRSANHTTAKNSPTEVIRKSAGNTHSTSQHKQMPSKCMSSTRKSNSGALHPQQLTYTYWGFTRQFFGEPQRFPLEIRGFPATCQKHGNQHKEHQMSRSKTKWLPLRETIQHMFVNLAAFHMFTGGGA